MGLDQVTWFSTGGDQPTVRSVAEHARRNPEPDRIVVLEPLPPRP